MINTLDILAWLYGITLIPSIYLTVRLVQQNFHKEMKLNVVLFFISVWLISPIAIPRVIIKILQK